MFLSFAMRTPELLPEHTPDAPAVYPSRSRAAAIALDRRAFVALALGYGVGSVQSAPVPLPSAELLRMAELLDAVRTEFTPEQETLLLELLAKRRSLVSVLRRKSLEAGEALCAPADKALDAYHFHKTRADILKLGYAQPPWLDAITLPHAELIQPHRHLQRVDRRRPEYVSREAWTASPLWLQWREAAVDYFAEQERRIEDDLHKAQMRGDTKAAEALLARRTAFLAKREADLKVLQQNEKRYP